MRTAFTLFFLVTLAGALLSSHAHKPFELRIDANPGAWPKDAAASDAQLQAMPNMLVVPCPLTPQNLPIMAERDA